MFLYSCRTSILFALSLALSACGGGSVQHQPYPDQMVPALWAINEIESANTPEDLHKTLDKLHGEGGQNLNWSQFWSLVGRSPAISILLNDEYREKFLNLHGRDCGEKHFEAYKQMLLKQGNPESFSYLRMPKRLCDGPISPNEAVTITLQEWQATQPEDQFSKAKELLKFLYDERQRSQSVRWTAALSGERSDQLIELFDTLLQNKEYRLAVSFWNQHRTLSGEILFPTYVQDYFFKKHLGLWLELIEQDGAAEATQLLYGMLKPLSAGRNLEQLDAQWLLLNKLLGVDETDKMSSFDGLKDWPAGYGHFRKLREMIGHFNEVPLVQRLAFLERLSDSFFGWASQNNSNGLVAYYIENEIEKAPNTLINMELIWLAYRMDPNRRESGAVKLRHMLTPPVAAEDRILQKRLRMFLAPIKTKFEDLLYLAEDFCAEMEANGIPSQYFSLERIDKRSAYTPGCKFIYPDKKNDSYKGDAFQDNPERTLTVSNLSGTANTVFILREFKDAYVSVHKDAWPLVLFNSERTDATVHWDGPAPQKSVIAMPNSINWVSSQGEK